MQQTAFWLPMHISNLSPWAVHHPVWLSCSSVYFGCLPEKESDPQIRKAGGSFREETRSFGSLWKPKWGHMAIIRTESVLTMLHLLPMHTQQDYLKNLQMVTLIDLVAHLAPPTDRMEHLWLRALSIPSVLQDVSYVARWIPQNNEATVKLKLHPTQRIVGTLRLLNCRKKSGPQISKVFPKSA